MHLEEAADIIERPSRGSVTLDFPSLQLIREYQRLELCLLKKNKQENTDPPQLFSALIESISGTKGPCEIRNWLPGDRMKPRRLKGRSKKISDLYTDAKVPRRKRADALVVVRQSDGAIIWAQYLGPAHDTEIIVNLTGSHSVASNSE